MSASRRWRPGPRWMSPAWDGPEHGPPPTRRKFIHEWDRLAYLYEKADYWLRWSGERHRATGWLPALRALAERLAAGNASAILVWASRALVAEADGDLAGAARCTRRVVSLLERLSREPGLPDGVFDPADLEAERAALARMRVGRRR